MIKIVEKKFSYQYRDYFGNKKKVEGTSPLSFTEISRKIALSHPLDGMEDEYNNFCPSVLPSSKCCGRKMILKISSDLVITEFCRVCKKLNTIKL